MTIRHQLIALPMLPAVIDRDNLLGQREPTMLTFTDRHGQDIGDNNPQDADSFGILDDNLIIIHSSMEIPGVDTTTDPAELQEWTLTLMSSPQEWIWTPMRGPWTPMFQLTITPL